MELTQVKNSLFGYKKADVVRYISELNELHNAEISAKAEEFDELKGKSEGEIESLKTQNEALADKVASLEEALSKLTTEFNTSVSDYKAVSEKYENLMEETKELRDKSDVIATAILEAEKCAGQMIDRAKDNADDMIRNAEDRVRVEKDKLAKAKDYIRQARAELHNTMQDIDSALSTAETELDAKSKAIDIAETKNDRKIDISLFKRA